MSYFLIYPHQLFEKFDDKIRSADYAVLVEEPLFFSQYAFHKQKLIFHRASMKSYQSYLEGEGVEVKYFEYSDLESKDYLLKQLKKTEEIYAYPPEDFNLNKKLHKTFKKIEFVESPYFLVKQKMNQEFFQKKNSYLMASYYQELRKALKILLTKDNKPEGGKWSFDAENRKKIPKDMKIPEIKNFYTNDFIDEATEYVTENFPDNPGDPESFNYAINSRLARTALDQFLEERFEHYGTYQDAIVDDQAFNFHSILSPYINSGLLTPREVIERVINFAKDNKIELNNLEGFVRQIIGWREYVRAIYHLEGVKQRTTNFWKHQRKIPNSFYEGTTDIKPVDDSIKKTLKYSYAHHIERLMILSNFMLLCEFDPDEVYQWFMELYIDAYDWVMVPNVYGMGQYSDGGLIVTKPYISSSNYVLKMSNYKKDDWCDVWDGLYWRFIDKHRKFFAGNPRLKMMTTHLDRMGEEKLATHKKNAEKFLNLLG